jgi:hypothetical protein
VTRAIDVGIVAVVGVVLDMSSRYRDTPLSFFGGFIDGAIVEVLCVALFCLPFRDRRCECSLAVIDVSNCACTRLELVLNTPLVSLQTYRC